MDSRFADTIYLVEANNNETLSLWKELHTQVNWEQDCKGTIIQVGELDNRPINISFFWSKINGKRIAFWEAISQVVDHKMIDDWFKRNLPNISRSNAMNFHNVLHHIFPNGIPYGPVTKEDVWELIERSRKNKQDEITYYLATIAKIAPPSKN